MFSTQVFSLDAFSLVRFVAMYPGGPGCFSLLLPRCRNPCILRPILMDDTYHLLSLPVARLAGLESAWRHAIICGVVQDDTYHLLSLPVARLAGLESAWRHVIICGVVQDAPVVCHCFPCQGEGGCFPP